MVAVATVDHFQAVTCTAVHRLARARQRPVDDLDAELGQQVLEVGDGRDVVVGGPQCEVAEVRIAPVGLLQADDGLCLRADAGLCGAVSGSGGTAGSSAAGGSGSGSVSSGGGISSGSSDGGLGWRADERCEVLLDGVRRGGSGALLVALQQVLEVVEPVALLWRELAGGDER